MGSVCPAVEQEDEVPDSYLPSYVDEGRRICLDTFAGAEWGSVHPAVELTARQGGREGASLLLSDWIPVQALSAVRYP